MQVRFLLGSALAMVLALAGATGAQAASSQSMVYVQGGNVFVANADMSDAHQVTTDGSATDSNKAYHSPTEADDGTIWAANGFALYHLNQNGTLIKEVVPPGGEYALAASVSADDSKVVYNWDIPAVDGYGDLGGQTGSSVITTSGGSTSYGDGTRDDDGTWLPDSSTIIFGTDKAGTSSSGLIDFQTPGGSPGQWFEPADPLGANRGTGFDSSNETFSAVQPAVDPTGTYLAVVERSSYSNNATPTTMQLYRMAGNPPAVPTYMCAVQAIGSSATSRDGQGMSEPRWDGSGNVYWYDSQGENAYNPASDPNCTGGQTLTLSNAQAFGGITQASFSPAADNPAASTGGSGGAGGGQARSFSKVGLALAKAVTLKALLTRGLPTTVTCNASCKFEVALAMKASLARQLKLTRSRKGVIAVGAAVGKLTGAYRTVNVKLLKRVANAIKNAKLKSLKLYVVVVAKGLKGKKSVQHVYALTVRR